MESTAINSIYVVINTIFDRDCDLSLIRKAFFREDDAIKYCEKMQRLADQIEDVWEQYEYKEIKIE